MRLIVLAVVLVALLLGAGAAPGAATAAGKPCWQKVIDDWYDNGRIDGVYPEACLREALRRIPEDVKQYGGFDDAVTDARHPAARSSRGRGSGGSASGLSRSRAVRGGGGGGPVIEPEPRAADPSRGLFSEAFDKLGPRNADSVPVPLLILAGLALLLMAAGASGLVARRLRARRVPVPPAPPGP